MQIIRCRLSLLCLWLLLLSDVGVWDVASVGDRTFPSPFPYALVYLWHHCTQPIGYHLQLHEHVKHQRKAKKEYCGYLFIRSNNQQLYRVLVCAGRRVSFVVWLFSIVLQKSKKVELIMTPFLLPLLLYSWNSEKKKKGTKPYLEWWVSIGNCGNDKRKKGIMGESRLETPARYAGVSGVIRKRAMTK